MKGVEILTNIPVRIDGEIKIFKYRFVLPVAIRS